MYLKSLELLGFKSFAAKTTLEFHRGVTAIVGPNGCGKSNVLDAIRWVLGEQSAKALRGGEMADVIFGGTDSRAALGMAEVSMTFADCEKDLGVEWNEVRITRRVFRDGKSEYLINKTPARLRDIQELFMDTGIGRSAYSIMEQGKLDQILSSKPDDRRAIFEEAAGITKYKSQKREALRKLEATEANLIRVADIIREVKRQIGSLQRQAGKARRYQSLNESLRIFDTHLTHRDFLRLASEMEATRAEWQRLQDAQSVYESEMAQQEVELSGFRSRLHQLDDEMSLLREQSQQVRNRIYSAENRIESHGHRVQEFESLISRNESEIAGAREKMQEQEMRIEETDALIQELLQQLRVGEESLRIQEAALAAVRQERQDLENEAARLLASINAAEQRLNQIHGERSALEGRREASEARLASLHAETSAASSGLAELESRLSENALRLQSLEAALAAAHSAIQSHTEELAVIQTERRSLDEQVRQSERRLAEAESKLAVLRNLEAAGEGLDEATQALLRGLDNPGFFQPAMVGALASLIEVEAENAAALEALLAQELQAVLCKDPQIAAAAMETLAHGNYGRGLLLPRDWISQPEPSLDGPLPEGAIAWLGDCLRGPAEILAFLRPRLNGVALVPDLETALRLREIHPGLGFVTRRGELLASTGLTTAGRTSNGTRAALLRKQEISALEIELELLRQSHAQILGERENLLAQAATAEAALQESRQEQQSLQVELSALRGESNLLERQLQSARQRQASLEQEVHHLELSLSQSSERILQLDNEVQTRSAEINSLREEQSARQLAAASARAREAEVTDQLNEFRVRVATERQQRENLQRQREPMAARLQELAELMAQRSADIENYRLRIGQLEAETAELQNQLLQWQEEIQSLEGSIAATQSQRLETQESAEALETTLRVARQQLQDLQNRRGQLEVKSTQIELRQTSLQEHISRRYGLDLSTFEPDGYALAKTLKEHKLAAAANPDPADSPSESPEAPPAEEAAPASEIPWEEIKNLVASLTERLDSMGPVNLDAIQEFDELEQRYQFLEQQNTDLTNSKAELLEVIARLNKTTRELFQDTFEKIRSNFQEMFSELFGGGKANLMLADENDPLESGIEIIAKPPGKQLQSISLLSGGERTMTAVALLFAIYMVKPSPFCVLDEMDAPLDESNISRFIKILDRFIGQSQFVVITHNKRTISRADLLYGVTMEEHGVSKLVGVRFENAAHQASHAPSVAEAFGKHGNLKSEHPAQDPTASLAAAFDPADEESSTLV